MIQLLKLGAPVMAAAKRSLWESECITPKCNGLANTTIHADFQGCRVHFCTFHCRNSFLLAPNDVIKRIFNAGISLPKSAACDPKRQ